jgi:hypothetical protein
VAERKSATQVVCDAGPLIHLEELGCFDLLRDFAEVVVRAIRREQRTKRQVLNLLRAISERTTLFVEGRLLEDVVEMVNRESLADAGER